MGVVALTGAVTALFAASMGVVQNDIKKVLAYSTVSQLGYMFLACGVGAFTAGIFHLMTHAFFKGLLFLAAGSVIHAVSGEQDMRKMGALSKKIPVTYWTMLIAALAIAGIFPFAGFISKDLILGKAYEKDALLWAIGYFTAGMTAFYMFRLIFMTFHGASRVDHEVEHHIHESPKSMTVPLMILAALSVVGGWIGVPASLGGSNHFERWLEPVIFSPVGIHAGISGAQLGEAQRDPTEYLLMVVSVLIALGGIWLARLIYLQREGLADKLAASWSGLYGLLSHKYYMDEIYDALFVNRTKDLATALGMFDRGVIDGLGVNGSAALTRFICVVSMWWDTWIVDGLVGLTGTLVRLTSYPVRFLQTGRLQSYALVIVLGTLLLLGYYLRHAWGMV